MYDTFRSDYVLTEDIRILRLKRLGTVETGEREALK